jgi:hypothetical protein
MKALLFAFAGAFVLLAGIGLAATQGANPAQAVASFFDDEGCDGEQDDDAGTAEPAGGDGDGETDDDQDACGAEGDDGETADDAPLADPDAAPARA